MSKVLAEREAEVRGGNLPRETGGLARQKEHREEEEEEEE